jgi:glycosyltransferase involved in cell wall biosynthesis
MTKVSVIIPLFNKELFIEQTLQSVLNQSYKNIDCIIVDDGSTDNGKQITQKFIDRNKLSWKLISQQNAGQTKARNHGIRLSDGDYLAFLDSDDLWAPTKIQSQVDVMIKNPGCILVLSAYAIFGSRTSRPRVVRHKRSKRMNSRWLDMRGFGGGLESLGLVRRSTIDEIGMFDEELSTSSGLDLSLRLAQCGEIVLLRQIGLYYRISDGQWHGNSDALKRDLIRLITRYGTSNSKKLVALQESYFYWTKVRSMGLLEFVKSIFFAIIKLDIYRILMLESLLSRNLYSQLLGWLERKQTTEFLSHIEVQR